MKDKMASDHLKSKKTDPEISGIDFYMLHSDAQRQHRKDGYL